MTVYLSSDSSGSCRLVSPSIRGFGPGLPGARRRPSCRSSAAIHSGAPSGRPIVGARSIRAVVAGSAGNVRIRWKISATRALVALGLSQKRGLYGEATGLRWRWGTAKVAYDVGVRPVTCPMPGYSITKTHSAAIDGRT